MHTFKEFALLCHWLYDCRDCMYRRFHRMEGIYLFVLLHTHSERCSFIPTPINWGENNVTDSHIILHDIFWTINIKLVYANSIFSFHHLDDQSKMVSPKSSCPSHLMTYKMTSLEVQKSQKLKFRYINTLGAMLADDKWYISWHLLWAMSSLAMVHNWPPGAELWTRLP